MIDHRDDKMCIVEPDRVHIYSQDVPLSPRHGQITGCQFKHLTSSLKSFAGQLPVSIFVLLICSLFLLSRIRQNQQLTISQIDVNKLWTNSPSNGWIQSSAPRSNWETPSTATNGYLLVRCNGGLNQQRSAICNAVLAARIMNATLVLPELDTNFYWYDKSGFSGIYDVDHFIKTLKDDVEIVRSVPLFTMVNWKIKMLKPVQIRPPRDAPLSWYKEVAYQKMKQQGAIYLNPFSHRLAEEIDNDEYQRLRCRVNYHALRFNEDIMKLSKVIVQRLRSEGHFMAIHLRFEMDMLAFAGCLAIFNPEEQEILRKYRKENFAEKQLEYTERRLIGKCPLTPEEVGLLLRAMGFNNSTRIYIAAGDIFGGEQFIQPLRTMFPHLVNRSSIVTFKELEFVNAEGKGLRGSAIDYMVCLLADIFMPTYDGPSNFANNLIGHRLYYGWRTTIKSNRKALAPIFMDREEGNTHNFETRIRMVMQKMPFGTTHPRVRPESFYTNPWPECFCSTSCESTPKHKCPASSVPANYEQFELAEQQEQCGEQKTLSEVLVES